MSIGPNDSYAASPARTISCADGGNTFHGRDAMRREGLQSTSQQIADPAEQLRRLLRVADVALAHLSPEDLLDELLVRVREILDADTAAVLLLNKETSELVATAAKGLEEEVEQGVRIPLGKGFAGRVAAERKPVVIGRVDHRNVLNPILRDKGVSSLIGVPLLVRGEVLGVLHVGTLAPRTFTDADAGTPTAGCRTGRPGLARAAV